ncbi:MAG TPA: TIGR02302 family protein [Rhizomicrobium sp.]|jgi:uncharacterized protein (TIGR02302 family)|nr:TIGR02302 family protein [Rhizomicrobium sp.]
MTRLLHWIKYPIGLLTDRIERLVVLARAALVWERVWPALWPASAVVGLYVAAGLFNLFAYIPHDVHGLLLALMIVGAGYGLYLGFRGFRWPEWTDGARRIERDSALAHRPLTERDDEIAAGRGDTIAEEFWRAHIRALLASIKRLRLGLPRPGLPARDPYALRFAVLLLVVGGFFVAGDAWQARLSNAFLPQIGARGTPALLDAWINPPAYTGEAPIYLSRAAKNEAPIAVPAGSVLVLRVHGAHGLPSLRISPSPDDAPRFKGKGDEFAANYKLHSDGKIAVRANGRAMGDWNIKVLADSPPSIAFSKAPEKTEHDALKLSFTAADDYGVASAKAIITPMQKDGKTKAKGKPLTIDLPLPSTTAKTLDQTVYRDLTANPYAGLPVEIVLVAKDGAGQSAKSKPRHMRLPARVFTDPLARALIEQRQKLAIGGNGARDHVSRMLDALTIAPDKFYAGKSGVYLAIRTAYWGLSNAHGPEDIQRVQDLLWQTALALENGGQALAAEELRRIQQQLSQALAQGAPQDVIDALLQRYNQAMQNYLRSMAQNAQRNNAQPSPNAKTLSEQDLQSLLNAIQQLAQTGARDKAQQMLAMLQSLLENLHMSAGNGQGQGQGSASPQDKAMSDAIGKLGDLMGKQRQLLDKTFRQQQGAGDPKDGGARGLAQQQGKLREDLDKILKGLEGNGKKPDSLGEAGRDMGQAQGQLGARDLYGAGDAQADALKALREGTSDLAKELMKRSGRDQGQQQGGNEDPLGRAQGATGPDFGSGVKIPDKSDLERARDILQELRKRAAERGRPKEELDYLDRLLKQF